MACKKVKIKVNDRFSTYKEFEEVLTEYKKSHLQEFWIRDARTISNQRKRSPDSVSKANEELKYYYVRLSCTKGGRKYKSKNENSTRKCTTIRQDCPASIFLKISPCQQALIVVEINESHCHSTTKTAFNYLSQSQQRLKLPETIKQTAKDEMLHRKFTIMDGYGRRMAQLSSEVSTKAFNERVNLIRKVIEMWEEGKDSVLNENFSRIFESDAEKSQEISIHYEEHSESQESTKGNRNSINLQNIKMPRKRGRPKGFGNTVIVLKRQKSKTTYRTPPVKNAETEQCLKEDYLDAETEQFLKEEYLEVETEQFLKEEYLEVETEQCLKEEYLEVKTEQFLKEEYLEVETEQCLKEEYLEEEYLDDEA